MKRRWWRLGFRVVACLGAGVVVTVLVAWAAVARMQDGVDLWANAIATPGYWGPRVSAPTRIAALWRGAPAASSVIIAAVDHDSRGRVLRMEFFDDAGGWPLLALACGTRTYENAGGVEWSEEVRRSVEVRPADIRRWEISIRLPLVPLWEGVVVNSACSGAVILVLWSAPGLVRRRLRRGRGACVGCGYDLRGSVGGGCPECGEVRREPER